MKVYIAHSYGRRHGVSEETLEKNFVASIFWTRELIKLGHKPFNPLFFHVVHKDWDESPDEKTYFDLVACWIENCDCLFVAKQPSWTNSGVNREIKIAEKLGIPVIYSLEDIPNEREATRNEPNL